MNYLCKRCTIVTEITASLLPKMLHCCYRKHCTFIYRNYCILSYRYQEEIHNVFAQNPTERFGGWFVRFSGMEVRFNSAAEKGKRVESVTVNGEPLENERSYTISACYREGDPKDMLCRIPNVEEVSMKPFTMHDVVMEYLQKFSPVKPLLDGRAIATDLGPFTFSTLPGTNYQFR